MNVLRVVILGVCVSLILALDACEENVIKSGFSDLVFSGLQVIQSLNFTSIRFSNIFVMMEKSFSPNPADFIYRYI